MKNKLRDQSLLNLADIRTVLALYRNQSLGLHYYMIKTLALNVLILCY